MTRLFRHFLISLTLALLTAGAFAQTTGAPPLMNFQGRLAKPDGTPVSDGTYSIRFSLWDAVTNGTEKWNQTVATVNVRNGVFAVLLNVNTPNLFDADRWLEIKIGNDTPLAPRQQLVSVAYALKANTVPDGAITTAKIADNAVTSNKIANDAASLNKVSGGALTTEGINIHAWGNISMEVNKVIGYYPPDAFTYSGVTMGNYTLGWMLDPENGGGYSAWLSGWAGIKFFTGFKPRLAITGGGNVGIGTTSPEAKLQVNDGGIRLLNSADNERYELNYASGYFYIDEYGAGRRFVIQNGGNVGIGTTTPQAKLDVNGTISAQEVDVVGGSDVAEPYRVTSSGNLKPIAGMVVAIDPQRTGQMRVSHRAYDQSVSGIISGANGIKPGITLRQKGTIADGALPVASMGRVWCWCDADASGPILPGNLLTTSNTPGHAMKVTDYNKARGAILGKAMSTLKKGKGLVLVLVTLQ